MGLPLRLGLLLGDPPQGSGRRRRQQLEERQRHRPLYADRLHLRQLQRLRQDLHQEPDYWDKEKIGGQEYKLPFVDKITYRTIKDEATYITALRTGKLDMLEAIRWQNVDSLKKSAPQLQWNRWLEPVRHLHGDAHRRRRAVQGRPRAPRAQLRGQQGRDRQGLLQRQRRAVRLSAASRLRRLLRAAGQAAGLGAGAVQVRPGEGQEAPGRSRVPQGLHHQGPGLLVQSRPHGPAAAGRGLPRAGRREARDPAAGVRRLPVGDDLAHAYAGLLHEQRPHQPDHDHPQELHHGPAVESRRAGRIPSTTRRWTWSIASPTRPSARSCCAR